MSGIEVLPDELLAAAEPLRRAAEALEDVANSRRSLHHLVEASPSARLAEAFRGFLSTWELTVWSAADEAAAFADHTELAGAYYAQREALIARNMPVTTPWGEMPPLRDPVVQVPVPHPAAQAAPVPGP
ncbi:MAG: hypothetical protein JWP11_214 [Frankiales bacterium]|nr:hypothetical protein [Frankiales bacterium]